MRRYDYHPGLRGGKPLAGPDRSGTARRPRPVASFRPGPVVDRTLRSTPVRRSSSSLPLVHLGRAGAAGGPGPGHRLP
jgi:hypothetical protein